MKWDDWEILITHAKKIANKHGERYIKRLDFEDEEITKQGANDYWLELANSDKKYDTNKNGLVLPFILGVTIVDPIKENIPHNTPYVADYPDVDSDFLPYARDEIKRYAVEKYGEDKVCTVGNWNTFRLKQALQDSCRVLDGDLGEVVRLTKQLNDEEYDKMDAEELCDACPEFKDYYGKNKEIVDLALQLRGRIKSQGQHAGGIIISSRRLSDTIPMSFIKGKFVSQWTEGMAATQLSPFGLVKFDLLGLKTMAYNVYTEQLIKQSRGITIDWSECDPSCAVPYAGFQVFPDGTRKIILFNDKKAIKMADEIKTEAVFQFDTHVAKGVLSNGVTSFNDLVVYTALARPGPMQMIPELVARRDDPRELWKKKEDPRVVEMLKDTFGVICYQEQLTMFWTKFGGLTVPEAEKARKAVAKKKKEEIIKLGPRIVASMIKNGFANDPVPQNDEGVYEGAKTNSAQGWWNKMVTFGRYCFNKCLSGDTMLYDPKSGKQISIQDAYFNGGINHLYAYNGEVFVDDLISIHFNGFEPVYEVEFSNGEMQTVTKGHKFMNEHGQMEEVWSLFNLGHAVKYISGGVTNVQSSKRTIRKENSRAISSGPYVQGYKGENWIGCSFGWNYNKNNQEIQCSEKFYNEGYEFCRSLLLRQDKPSKQSLLAGDVDSRWLYSRGSQLCELTVGGDRCGVSDSVWYRSEITTQAVNMQKEEFHSNSPNCEQQTFSEHPERYEYTTGKVNERSFAGSSFYVSFDKGICGRRRVYYCKFKRISNASDWIKLLVFRDDSKHICARMWGEELKDYNLQEQFLCDLLDWIISIEAHNEVSVSRCREIHEKEKAGGRCYITSIRFRGVEPVYSPEMKSSGHNYIINKNSSLIHANSHAYAYGVIAYRSLWLKAHYPTEFWASQLTYRHPDKIPKYVGVAKSEGVKFKPLRVGYFSNKLTVDSDHNVYPSLIMIKGIGESVSEAYCKNGGQCKDIDDFIERYGKKKVPMERLIKLGAFDEIHSGKRKHLWFWYLYKYCSKTEEVSKIREIADTWYRQKYWPEEKILAERKRQIDIFRLRYPKKKLLKKIENWEPKIGYKHNTPTREDFFECFTHHFKDNIEDDPYHKDWTIKDLLNFEKEFFGVYWSSPMVLFTHSEDNKFARAKEQNSAKVDGIIEKIDSGITNKGTKFLNVLINDGVESDSVRIWSNSVQHIDTEMLKEGHGIRIEVEWNEQFQNFSYSRGGAFQSLRRKNVSPE